MENKIIKVNKKCIINTDNIAKCKDREIAVNITCLDECEENGFINYTLAIENGQHCCEDFGTKLVILSDEQYVGYIVHNVQDEVIRGFVKKITRDIDADYIVSAIYGKYTNLIAIAYCYNAHNGYYGHYVYADLNNEELEVEYI